MSGTTQTLEKPRNSPTTTARPVLLQRKCACGGSAGTTGDGEWCNKRLNVQRRATREAEPSRAPHVVDDVLRSPGESLDQATRAFMEPRFGHDFSGVRVHTDAKASESARAVNALAYTVGSHVVFGAGQYAPGTTEGQKLLAHELTHVLQQGTAPDGPQGHLQVNPHDDVSEAQASDTAESILMHRRPAERALSSSLGFLQRQSDRGGSTLQASQFKGDPVLEACLNNLHTMMAGPGGTVGDHGAAVRKVQQALLDLGFELPKYGVDGEYGGETQAAVEAFQASRPATGKVDGKIGPKTMDALDASFPPRKTAAKSESRAVPDTVKATTVKKGETDENNTKDPEVETEATGTGTVTSSSTNPEAEREPAFQLSADLISVQSTWRLAGPPGGPLGPCDAGSLQIGGKWNWKGVPIGRKLTLFSEPALNINVLPPGCDKTPGITLQDNVLKWIILKNIWELSLAGAFGLKDGWLKNWGDRPLTGMVGPELDWSPWSGKTNSWYSGIKFKMTLNSVWEKAPKGTKDTWSVQAAGGVSIELP